MAGASLASFAMHLDDPADASLCAFCRRRWSEVNDGSDWLNVEITGSDGRDGLDFIAEDFCSQGHAAQWLSRPLPPVAAPYDPPPRSWKDRLVAAAWGSGCSLLWR
jgi:hypothetical protein